MVSRKLWGHVVFGPKNWKFAIFLSVSQSPNGSKWLKMAQNGSKGDFAWLPLCFLVYYSQNHDGTCYYEVQRAKLTFFKILRYEHFKISKPTVKALWAAAKMLENARKCYQKSHNGHVQVLSSCCAQKSRFCDFSKYYPVSKQLQTAPNSSKADFIWLPLFYLVYYSQNHAGTC